MGRLIDESLLQEKLALIPMEERTFRRTVEELENAPTVEAIPKDNVYKAIQEMMKYEHEGFINISLARLDEILKKCGVSEDAKNT